MVKKNDKELERLFSQAERAKTCLVPADARIRESLRRQIERGKVLRPARGMYARVPYWRELSRPQRALHVLRSQQAGHPDWTFSHESAALAYGLPVSFDRLDTIHVAVPSGHRSASSKTVRWHQAHDGEFVERQGIRVTPLVQTVFDCMRTESFEDALAIADGALRLSRQRPSFFITRFERIGKGRTGTRNAVRTMYYADARSESGGESIARAMMIQQGFALPELQVALPQPFNPSRTFRPDFLWTRLDGSKVIGEFDGMQKYEDEAFRKGRLALRVLADEQHRESQLTLYGMPILRLSHKDTRDPSDFAAILSRYGIPQSDEAARPERTLSRSRSRAAHIFTVESLDGSRF